MTQGRDEYGFLANSAKRARFYEDLNRMLVEWEYNVVVCVFEKHRFAPEVVARIDLYHFGLDLLLDRFCLELGSQLDAGYIYAEKRRPDLDRELMTVWDGMTEGDAGADLPNSQRSQEIEERVVGLELRDKKPHDYGLQLADLVVTPPGRHVAGLVPNPNQVQWSVVEGKLCRERGDYRGVGLIVLP